jgi:hypothetical protein
MANKTCRKETEGAKEASEAVSWFRPTTAGAPTKWYRGECMHIGLTLKFFAGLSFKLSP